MGKNKLIILLSVFIVIGCALYFLIYTTPGSQLVAGRVISEIADREDIAYSTIEGNLGSGLILENLEIKDIKDLPLGSVLRIQKLFLRLKKREVVGF